MDLQGETNVRSKTVDLIPCFIVQSHPISERHSLPRILVYEDSIRAKYEDQEGILQHK